MARAQQQSVGTITVWMIVFVALWLISTVFLVILYTRQEELQLENTRVSNDNLRLISRSERNSLELFQNARKEGPTVVGLLERARSETARLATGEAADDLGTVRTKLEQVLETIRRDGIVPDAEAFQDVSYHKTLTTLYEAFKTEHELLRDPERGMEKRLADCEAEVSRLVEANAQQKNNLDKMAKELSDQLANVEADRDRFRAEWDEQVAQLVREFDKRRQQNEADLTKERQRSSTLQKEAAQLEDRIAAFHERLGDLLPGPEPLVTARQPDGRILTYIPGDDFVYINLGQKDRLVKGLQFAVYSADTGIPPDGRAKAQVEVVDIYPSSAECKIVHVRGNEVITQGDLVANPVYDPNRPVSFLVLGEFDLNRDGVIDADGVAVIESMITNWGGELSPELTALTDFVVLGAAPRRPKPARDQSPEEVARNTVMQQVYDRYVETVRQAETLSVPILTQEIFLNFLGYAGRLARR